MDVGLHVINFSFADAPGSIAPTLGRVAGMAEDVGFHRLSVMDHYFQMEIYGLNARMEMLEGYTTLGFLAAQTQRVKLGLMVTGVNYRYPGLLAKIVTTLDVLSGGRAFLGIGAGWYEREHKGLGVPLPGIGERLDRLEDTLKICRQMWSDDEGPFTGKRTELAETINVPPPIQQRIPVLVGGGGEKRLLRLLAEHADACNLFTQAGEDVVRHKLEVLRKHCDDVGRDFGEIRKTVLHGGPADPDALVEAMRPYAAMGIEEVIVMPDDDPVRWVERISPAVERLADL